MHFYSRHGRSPSVCYCLRLITGHDLNRKALLAFPRSNESTGKQCGPKGDAANCLPQAVAHKDQACSS
jgi:hypothetical protein